MLVSIIIRTLNEEKHLDALLSCIDSQESAGLNYEIIVVDSGSDDHTLEITIDAKRAAVHERNDWGACRCELSLIHIQVGDIAVERRADGRPAEVEQRFVKLDLGLPDTNVGLAGFAEIGLRLVEISLR